MPEMNMCFSHLVRCFGTAHCEPKQICFAQTIFYSKPLLYCMARYVRLDKTLYSKKAPVTLAIKAWRWFFSL